MAIKKRKIQMRNKHANGDTELLYPVNRPKDIEVSGSKTLEPYITKVDGVAAGSTKVEKSGTNGNVKINGTETAVYAHPNSGATAGSYNKVTVDVKGHVTGGSNVTDWSGSVSGNTSNGTVAFTTASSRANLTTNEKLSAAFGKLAKWYTDLKALAWLDKVGTSQLDTTLLTAYNKRVITDKVTTSTSITETGWVADARAIAALQNQINTINSKLTGRGSLNEINANANDYIETGVYSLGDLAGTSNFLSGGTLVVYNCGSYVLQFSNSTDPNYGMAYRVRIETGEWREWVRQASLKQIWTYSGNYGNYLTNTEYAKFRNPSTTGAIVICGNHVQVYITIDILKATPKGTVILSSSIFPSEHTVLFDISHDYKPLAWNVKGSISTTFALNAGETIGLCGSFLKR